MPDFRRKGFSYETITHTGKKNKYEHIKWESGYRNFWTRITEQEYLKAKNDKR